ncbi:MAG: DNA polymerase III subunit beta [Erysipelotrichaceae bacterium]|nr:DNA polymerase III subunit beta [Erysipelotrichaceae bacterium]
MKILCPKSQFLLGVNTVSKAVSNKTTMDILQCILIEAYQGCIRFTANDTELGIETCVEGEILEEGKIALEAKIFSEIIKKIPDTDVILETEENGKTTIHCEQVQCSIMGKIGDDFTHLPQIERTNPITISQFDLKEVINKTIFSVSDNENNKLMTGELLSIKNDTFTLTSLDGHRISVRNVKLANEYEDMEVIVPGKTLSDVSKILSGDAKEFVNLYITEKHVLFEFGQTLVVSRLLEGKFYNINQMLSTDYETKIVVNKMEFLRCLDRSTLFTKESDKKPIILKIENEKMDVMISSQIGSMKDQIRIQKEGKNLVIGFNPKFLADALRVVDEEEVSIYLINSIAPCVIRDDERSYLYLILPINVNNTDF